MFWLTIVVDVVITIIIIFTISLSGDVTWKTRSKLGVIRVECDFSTRQKSIRSVSWVGKFCFCGYLEPLRWPVSWGALQWKRERGLCACSWKWYCRVVFPILCCEWNKQTKCLRKNESKEKIYINERNYRYFLLGHVLHRTDRRVNKAGSRKKIRERGIGDGRRIPIPDD